MITAVCRPGTPIVDYSDDRLPGNTFRSIIPEWLCTTEGQVDIGDLTPVWHQHSPTRIDGEVCQDGSGMAVQVVCHEDHVDVTLTITNGTHRPWELMSDFTCWPFSLAPDFADWELNRTWIIHAGQPRRIISLPRHQGPRPLFSFYPVQPVERFERMATLVDRQATSPATADAGLIAVGNITHTWTAVIEAVGALFVFNNGEYACLHACHDFGTTAPGAAVTRTTRLWLQPTPAEACLAALLARQKSAS